MRSYDDTDPLVPNFLHPVTGQHPGGSERLRSEGQADPPGARDPSVYVKEPHSIAAVPVSPGDRRLLLGLQGSGRRFARKNLAEEGADEVVHGGIVARGGTVDRSGRRTTPATPRRSATTTPTSRSTTATASFGVRRRRRRYVHPATPADGFTNLERLGPHRLRWRPGKTLTKASRSPFDRLSCSPPRY